MAKNRVTRKQQLKEPDEFITTASRVVEWARENTRALVVGICVLLAIAALLSIYSYHRQSRADTAEMRLGQALDKYETAMEGKDATAALAAVRDDFNVLTESYGGTPAGRLGAVIYGNLCIAGLDYDDAVVQYKKSLARFGTGSSLSNVILNGLATAYQQKGDYNQAVSYYTQMADGTGQVLKDAALYNLGRLYGQLGKADESREAYNRLGAEFPQSMYAALVK